jgi:tripartite ATP-independent transporter DctP family solute receptor
MKKFTKWGATVLTASMMLITAACGGGGATTSSTGSTAPAATTSGGGDAAAKPTYNFKLAHITPPTHMWHIAAEKFRDELDQRSGGRMKLEIYPSSQLGTEADMVQQIAAGSVDFGFITAAYLSSRAPSYAAWLAPYAFKDLNEANEARKAEVSKKILATLEEQGLVGLDYFFAGQRVMLFKDKEVLKPEDMAGLKLRVTPSPPLTDFYTSTGAATEGLPLPEVYSAVQTGVIDGMDMDLDAAITNKYYEVVKYGAVTNHMVWPAVAMVSKAKFDPMPEEDKQIIREAIDAAANFSATTRQGQEEEFKKTLSDNGMKIYQIDPALFAPHIKQFDEKYGPKDPLIQEFIDTFRK